MNKIIKLSALALPLMLALAGCSDHDSGPSPVIPTGEIEDKIPTTDALGTKVKGAYVEYGDVSGYSFANAVISRHELGKGSANANAADNVTTVFIAGSSLDKLSADDCADIARYILADKTVLITQPTVAAWNSFAARLADAYTGIVLDGKLPANATDAAKTFFGVLRRDVDAKQSGSLYGLPVVKAQSVGDNDDFSSILFIKGNTVRSYDHDCYDHPVTTRTESYKRDKDGNSVLQETSEPTTLEANGDGVNGFLTGQMADDLVYHITSNDSHSGAKTSAPKTAVGETASDLQDLMEAQHFSHVFRVKYSASDYNGKTERGCLVEANYDIWPVYDFDHQTDYYLVHQTLTSHNGDMCCTSTDKEWSNINGNYVYLGNWAGDMYMNIDLLDEQGNAVENARVTNPQPATHQGTTSYTSGMTWGLNANVGLNKQGPSIAVGGSLSYTSSYTTTAPDYAVELNNSGTKINWKFIASNCRIIGHWAMSSSNCTHDIVPSCYRNDCTFNQSFIYTVQNPTSQRYVLDAYTREDLVGYRGYNVLFYMYDDYCYESSEAKYQVVMNPPTRYKSDWYMTIEVPEGVKQDKVRQFLQAHYPKYWNESFTCYTFMKDDTLPVKMALGEFLSDINNDLISWKAAGFTGKYTISVHPSTSSQELTSFSFTVE